MGLYDVVFMLRIHQGWDSHVVVCYPPSLPPPPPTTSWGSHAGNSLISRDVLLSAYNIIMITNS